EHISKDNPQDDGDQLIATQSDKAANKCCYIVKECCAYNRLIPRLYGLQLNRRRAWSTTIGRGRLRCLFRLCNSFTLRSRLVMNRAFPSRESDASWSE